MYKSAKNAETITIKQLENTANHPTPKIATKQKRHNQKHKPYLIQIQPNPNTKSKSKQQSKIKQTVNNNKCTLRQQHNSIQTIKTQVTNNHQASNKQKTNQNRKTTE